MFEFILEVVMGAIATFIIAAMVYAAFGAAYAYLVFTLIH